MSPYRDSTIEEMKERLSFLENDIIALRKENTKLKIQKETKPLFAYPSAWLAPQLFSFVFGVLAMGWFSELLPHDFVFAASLVLSCLFIFILITFIGQPWERYK